LSLFFFSLSSFPFNVRQLFLVRERERKTLSPLFSFHLRDFQRGGRYGGEREKKQEKKYLPRSCRFEIFNKDLIDAPCVLHVDGQGREWAHFTVGREGVRKEEALVFKGNGSIPCPILLVADVLFTLPTLLHFGH